MVTAVVVVTMGLRLLLERALPRFGAGSRPMLGIYAVHVVLVAASVVLNPLACIYAFVGYLVSYRFFSDQQQYVLDRKSTRLNSSHVAMSYVVHGLSKKA